EAGLPIEPAHRGLEQRRLAGSDLAGDDDEPGAALDSVSQVDERLAMDLARVEVVGIRAEGKRPLPEVVEAFIHDEGFSQSARGPRRAPPFRPRRWPEAPRFTRASSPPESRCQSMDSLGIRRPAAAGAGRTR